MDGPRAVGERGAKLCALLSRGQRHPGEGRAAGVLMSDGNSSRRLRPHRPVPRAALEQGDSAGHRPDARLRGLHCRRPGGRGWARWRRPAVEREPVRGAVAGACGLGRRAAALTNPFCNPCVGRRDSSRPVRAPSGALFDGAVFKMRRPRLRRSQLPRHCDRAHDGGIAAGHEDADDLDALRFDPALMLACNRELGAREIRLPLLRS